MRFIFISKSNIYILILALLIGIILGMTISEIHINNRSEVKLAKGQIRADLDYYKFINPLLFSNTEKDSSSKYNQLINDVDHYFNDVKKEDPNAELSFYFRDLNSGEWTGIDEDQVFLPASMLKVIVMMAVLKIAETDPDIMNVKIYYKPDAVTKFYEGDTHNLEGYYSVEELISFMIIYSDNAAATALLSNKGIENMFNLVYLQFRMPQLNKIKNNEADFMSARSYSLVFRALYNSTVFKWNLSEQALDLLSKTDFDSGIVAGIPKGIVVSHKFGETGYKNDSQKTVRELHDCGIVYYPKHPYFVCLMTKGEDFHRLEKVISQVSSITWNAQSNFNK